MWLLISSLFKLLKYSKNEMNSFVPDYFQLFEKIVKEFQEFRPNFLTSG